MKIGARTFKTAIAIFIAVYIPVAINLPELTVLSGLAVVASIQPSVKRSYITLRDRVLSNAIGGLVAYITATQIGVSPFLIGLASLFLIALLHQFKLDGVISLAVMTLIIVMVESGQAPLYTAVTRVSATVLGVIIAFVINTFVWPPKYDHKLFELTNHVSDNIMRNIRIALRKNTQYGVMKKDLKTIDQDIDTMELFFKYIKEGHINPFRIQSKYSISRLLVVYRQFIKVTRSALKLALTLQRSENIFNHFDEDLRLSVRERIEVLMSAHEQILQKWNGRVLPEEVKFMKHKRSLRKEFMDSFYHEASIDNKLGEDYIDSNTVFKIMSSILEYEESLIHLNTLVSVYVKNHANESDILETNFNKPI
ncbi:Predicted membrane protein [Alloiococcus otitis]|uniref:Aromatic acid exporter family protein n=1 Tax=Alloiococcus otitis ATCC 51267 TaxID=883081 RepID=K9E9Z1_9LACT|nr:aromatic acid exporter family protein [Alloiococcus otitis]EKU94034.1 hypothetical protein HMPREF9698_00346 [Alloiococcus otitis ATCC 51267]SUU81052.1 Predicted membrane protein [Alloiococcus otitis]